MSERDFDLAEISQRREVEIGLQQARAKLHNRLLPVGTCYNCQEGVHSAALFCDSDCEKDYTARVARSVQNQ